MASISKREDDRADEIEPAPWDERPVVGTSQGLPWWQAIVLAFGLTLFAAVVDIQFNDKPTILFQGAYFVACLAAVGWVQRGSLFTPMVQPPLILATIVPGIVMFSSEEVDGSGLKDILLGYGLPVINGFPTMAITTGVTLATGFARMLLQRDPDRAKDDDDDLDAEPAKRPLLGRPRRSAPERQPDPERGSGRGMAPAEPPPGRGGREPAEPPQRRGVPVAGAAPGQGPGPAPGAGRGAGPSARPGAAAGPGTPGPGPGAKEPRPGAPAPQEARPGTAAAGRNPSGPTQRSPRTPPERHQGAPGAGPPPAGRRRAPSEPARRPTRPDGPEPPPRGTQPNPPPGNSPPPAGGPPPGGQPPRRRPPPPDDQQRPPRRQPPPHDQQRPPRRQQPPDDQQRPPRRQPPPRRPWDDDHG